MNRFRARRLKLMKRSRATVKKFEEVAAEKWHFLSKNNKFKQVQQSIRKQTGFAAN